MAKNDRNPNNNESDLFKSLTRLFSGPVTRRRTQSGRALKRRDLDNYASRFRSASGQQFKKSEYNPMNITTVNMISNRNRSERYVDFDQMEYTPEIASSLDIYADEMTTHSTLTSMLHIKCPNEEIKYILQSLYEETLNIEHNLFGWARTMCKYGDLFLYLDIDDVRGITNCIGLPPEQVERLEGEDKTNPNYVQYQWNSAGLTLENWQVAHFRVLGHDKYAPYGTSVLEPARRIWRQLTLLEDAMMAYRVIRATDRRIFKIDVGGIAPQDVEQYMQKVMTQMKRHQVVDPTTGRVDLRYNPLSIEEDYFIPIRGGQTSTDIQNLKGGDFTAAIDDVKYLRDKLFSALKIPQSYLTMGEGATEDKTTLAQKDIRFARTIQRLQRVVVTELEKIGMVHLFTLGYRGDDLLNFKLSLNNPSRIAEMQELESWKTKFDVAAAATDGYFSKRWVAENLLGLSEDEYIRIQREQYHDRKFAAALDAAGAAPEGGGASAGGLGDLTSDLGGSTSPTPDTGTTTTDTDTGDTGTDTAGAGGGTGGGTGGTTDTGGGDDDVLLAAPPGKRDDAPKKRGKYKKRQIKYRKGGLSKQMKNTATGGEVRGSTSRTTFPGKSGFGGLDSLARGVVEEQKTNILEENRLFNTSFELHSLLESLTNKERGE